VTLWSLDSGRAIQTFASESGPVGALAFSGDGRKLAAGGRRRDGTGRVIVWDAKTGDVLGALDTGWSAMFLAFHPNGARLAVANFIEAKIHLWDLATGRSIVSPGPAAVSCVGFTPDGNRMTALGYDGNVHLYDARTGDEVLVLRGFGGRSPGANAFTPRMAFSPDGRRIVAYDGISFLLNIWDLGPRSGSAAEPEAGDLAGWLRRGRALAEQGDLAGAAAAYARGRDIQGGDPSSWIEHAVTLWRLGDSTRARDALDRAMGALPDDPGRWVDLGRLLGRLGRTEESETALAKARSLLERQLSRVPDDEAAAAALAGLLPEPGGSRGWTILRPEVMTSAAGATLTPLPDGSVLAGGPNPIVDTYTVEATTDLPGITGLRLEALPDPSLPLHGPGRHPDVAEFLLGGIRLAGITGPSTPIPIHLTRVRSDFARRDAGLEGVSGAIDTNPITAWGIYPLVGRPHWAVFQAARPIGRGPGIRLRLELVCGQAMTTYFTLGRFRVSVTNRPFPFFEPSLLRIKADTERNGLTRLGAAYVLLGAWAPAEAVLARAAARPEASSLDGFLLALARHHLGHEVESRSDCNRALERPGSALADEPIHDVVVEALMTVRGLGVDEAEAVLQDLVFPADPFGPL
jgi:tetratricopeptide (TPR) repeat protein